MVAIMREADRDQVLTVAKRHGISEQTIYVWRKRFGGFAANDVRRLRQLEGENARLKKLVAERDLEIEVMKEVAAKKWSAPFPDMFATRWEGTWEAADWRPQAARIMGRLPFYQHSQIPRPPPFARSLVFQS
jgi:putative transposase